MWLYMKFILKGFALYLVSQVESELAKFHLWKKLAGRQPVLNEILPKLLSSFFDKKEQYFVSVFVKISVFEINSNFEEKVIPMSRQTISLNYNYILLFT